MTTEEPEWLVPTLTKYSPDSVCVIMQCVKAGLRKGECSANDVTTDNLDEVNVVGGSFKRLRRFGFVKTDRRVKGKRPEQHGRDFPIWVLEQRHLALHLLRHERAPLLDNPPEPDGQLVML